MKRFNLFSWFIVGLSICLGSFLFVIPVSAALELVKSVNASTIYYIDSYGARHSFPNLATYQSWYGNDFSQVISFSNETLSQYPLRKNITIRPGKKLVKVPSAPQVYAVEQGGLLREIKSEVIAEEIYGLNWSKKVVDLPEVFFSDYQLGPAINHEYAVPSSTLFQDKASKKYFYLNNNVLQEFASPAALAANHFTAADAFVSSRQYYTRLRPITGLDKNVFNPAAEAITDRRDCVSTDLKAAVIFITKDAYQAEEVQKVETIKNKISSYFSWATNELSKLDLTYPTSVLTDDGYILKAAGGNIYEINNEAINTFYDRNSDIFDFIFVFTNFEIPKATTNEIAYFTSVTNKVEGLGKSILDRSNIFGSQGKLKGIIVMGNVAQYTPGTPEGLSRALDIVAHELLHNWGAYIKFADETGALSDALLRDDKAHWSIYNGFISPLGGSGWIDNGNGSYTSGFLSMVNTDKRPYSQLDLYLMGLLPKQVIDPVMYLAPVTANDIGNVISAAPKLVTIDQIIKGSGPRQCSFD